MGNSSFDMHEEMFIPMLSQKEFIPLDQEKVAHERRCYVMTPALSSKWSALWDLMKLYSDAGLYDDAIAVGREVLSDHVLEEYHANALFRMGQLSEHKNDFDMALKFYLESIDKEAANPELGYWQHNNAGFCYLMKQEFERAEHHCRIALEFDEQNWKGWKQRWGDPHQWNAWKNMGAAMEYTGRYREAASFYTAAIKFSRGTERAVLHLRRLLKRHSDVAVYWKEPVQDLLTYYNVTV
jgi:tetratricopeptide (TPR) repeat protein